MLQNLLNNLELHIGLYFVIYGSYIAFILLYYAISKVYKKKNIIINNIFIIILLIFIYSRFIEPNIILVNNIKINTGFKARFAVVSDLHLGVYKGKYFLNRVVNKINNTPNIDAVLIPGDFALVIDKNTDFETLFSPFKNIKVPIYATLGNHDTQKPGPDIKNNLIIALKKYNIIILNNEKSKFKDINILGLGDNWSDDDIIEMIDDYSLKDNLIVLAHNPDTTLKYKNNIADITISGHTHGGQVRVPYLYKKVIPCKGNFINGFYEYNQIKTFVSSGAGEVGLPLRLGIPPEIVIMDMY